MSVVWKYSLKFADKQVVELPENAMFLDIQTLPSYAAADVPPQLWSKVEAWFLIPDENAGTTERTFYLYGTGQAMLSNHDHLVYLKTIRTPPYVWHFFEGIAND